MNFYVLIDFFLHIDTHLSALVHAYSFWAYAIIFVMIFIETGLVVTPFLPGDSLIFAVGALAAGGSPSYIALVVLMLIAAAVGGDTVNYGIGHLLREKVRNRENIPLVKAEYIDRAQSFFERHGGKAVTIARFIPIIRTFAPFVAWVGEMKYRRFLGYNVAGGAMWVSLMFSIGFFFGNIPAVKNHFGLVVIAIIVISVLPAAVPFVKSRLRRVDAA